MLTPSQENTEHVADSPSDNTHFSSFSAAGSAIDLLEHSDRHERSPAEILVVQRQGSNGNTLPSPLLTQNSFTESRSAMSSATHRALSEQLNCLHETVRDSSLITLDDLKRSKCSSLFSSERSFLTPRDVANTEPKGKHSISKDVASCGHMCCRSACKVLKKFVRGMVSAIRHLRVPPLRNMRMAFQGVVAVMISSVWIIVPALARAIYGQGVLAVVTAILVSETNTGRTIWKAWYRSLGTVVSVGVGLTVIVAIGYNFDVLYTTTRNEENQDWVRYVGRFAVLPLYVGIIFYISAAHSSLGMTHFTISASATMVVLLYNALGNGELITKGLFRVLMTAVGCLVGLVTAHLPCLCRVSSTDEYFRHLANMLETVAQLLSPLIEMQGMSSTNALSNSVVIDTKAESEETLQKKWERTYTLITEMKRTSSKLESLAGDSRYEWGYTLVTCHRSVLPHPTNEKIADHMRAITHLMATLFYELDLQMLAQIKMSVNMKYQNFYGFSPRGALLGGFTPVAHDLPRSFTGSTDTMKGFSQSLEDANDGVKSENRMGMETMSGVAVQPYENIRRRYGGIFEEICEEITGACLTLAKMIFHRKRGGDWDGGITKVRGHLRHATSLATGVDQERAKRFGMMSTTFRGIFKTMRAANVDEEAAIISAEELQTFYGLIQSQFGLDLREQELTARERTDFWDNYWRSRRSFVAMDAMLNMLIERLEAMVLELEGCLQKCYESRHCVQWC